MNLTVSWTSYCSFSDCCT